MTIVVVTPAARGSRKGNRVTALRWAEHLRALGHHVVVEERWTGAPCDLLVALHATRSHGSVEAFRAAHPAAPLVVGLAGTDLYQDLPSSPAALRSLALATRVTVLQPAAVATVPARFRQKVRSIVQSANPAVPTPAPPGVVQACMLAHLRDVKQPFLAAEAARALPPRSRVRVLHLGAALDPGAAERARREAEGNPRYAWLGERHRREALSILAGSAALLVTSRMEGGSNAVSEAVASGVPVLSTRIEGSVGLLGDAYPGYFPVDDAPALTALLLRLEEDAPFRAALRAGVERVRPLVDPARERAAWRDLLHELTGPDAAAPT